MSGIDTPTAKARGILSSTWTAFNAKVLHPLPERLEAEASRSCVPHRTDRAKTSLDVSDSTEWEMAWFSPPQTRSVPSKFSAGKEFLPATGHSELSKSDPRRDREMVANLCSSVNQRHALIPPLKGWAFC